MTFIYNVNLTIQDILERIGYEKILANVKCDLYMKDCVIIDGTINQLLCHLPHRMGSLVLDFCHSNDYNVDLTNLNHITSLDHLYLSNVIIDESTVSSLPQSITSLSMCHCKLSNGVLSRLSHLSDLDILSLHHNSISTLSDSDIKTISKIRYLNLNSNKLNDASIIYRLLNGIPSLNRLLLADNDLYDSIDEASILKHQSIKHVCLTGTRMYTTDESEEIEYVIIGPLDEKIVMTDSDTKVKVYIPKDSGALLATVMTSMNLLKDNDVHTAALLMIEAMSVMIKDGKHSDES